MIKKGFQSQKIESGCNKIIEKPEKLAKIDRQLKRTETIYLLNMGFYFRAFSFSFGENVSATAKNEN